MVKNLLNQKLSKLWGKMDAKILNSKINKSIEMLQNSDTSEIEKQLKSIDTDELIQKLDEFDKSKIDELNLDKQDLKEKISKIDFKKFSSLLGEKGDEIILKLQKLLD